MCCSNAACSSAQSVKSGAPSPFGPHSPAWSRAPMYRARRAAELCGAGAQTEPGVPMQPPCAGERAALHERTRRDADLLEREEAAAAGDDGQPKHQQRNPLPVPLGRPDLEGGRKRCARRAGIRVCSRHAPPGHGPPMRRGRAQAGGPACREQHVRIPGRGQPMAAGRGGPGGGRGPCESLRRLTMY